jgi:hypothetical protein
MASRQLVIDEHEIIWLIAGRHTQRRLCADLERIADNLPDLPSAEAVRHIEDRLFGYADRHLPHQTELFRRLLGDTVSAPAARILKEIQHNHAVDAMHADDLSVELRRLSGASRAVPAGELAYMLHCFFDGCRRAMAYEELALLNFGEERLTPAAKSAVMQSFLTG